MIGEITIRFRYTEREYVSAVRMYFARTLNPGRDLILAPIFVAGCLYWWLSSGYEWPLVVLVTLSVLLFAISLHLLVITPTLHWRTQPKLREEYTLKFSDEGITFATEHIDSKIGWELYQRVFENKDFFVLVYGKNLFTVIPRRAFSGPDEEAAFRELAKRNILCGIQTT